MLRTADDGVQGAAHILGAEHAGGSAVRARLGGLLGAMGRHRGRRGEWSGCVDHSVKGTRSYWPGLFRG